jgi:hypothetical protein
MIKDLTVRRPLGHCIARALQLLKTEPFADQPGISQICSVAFDGKSTNRIGLPKSGKPLSDHPGLFALANLFYDTVTIGSPNLTIGRNTVDGQPSSFDEYVAFMRTLSMQYTGENKVTDWDKKGLSDINNKRDKDGCKSANEISLSSDTTDRVYTIVKEMFTQQVAHSSECYKIISMLFTITYDPTTKKPTMFKLNDDIIRKGFPELERVNREARKILVEYYTSCEAKYKAGMDIVLEGQKAKIDAVKAATAQKDAIAKDAQTQQTLLASAAARDTLAKEQAAKKLATGAVAAPVVGKPRVAAPVVGKPRVAAPVVGKPRVATRVAAPVTAPVTVPAAAATAPVAGKPRVAGPRVRIS